MATTLYKEQSSNILKTYFLMALFVGLITSLGLFFSYYYNDIQILYGAVILSIIMNIGSYWFGDKIALGLSHAQEIQPDLYPEHLELKRIVENLSITAGLPTPRIYIIADPSPNAFATGRNKTHSSVAVTTGLLSILDRSELEGVIAHELAHIDNRDILLSTVVVILVGLISLASDFFIRISFFGQRDSENKSGHPIFLIIGIIFIILSPFVATIIQLAISRKREFLADATGALLTRYPEGLAHALEKIEAHTLDHPLKSASNATAHMYILNPFGSRAYKGFAKLFMTHPPTEERIKALMGLKI